MSKINLQEMYKDIDINALDGLILQDSDKVILTKEKQENALQKFSNELDINDIELQEVTPNSEDLASKKKQDSKQVSESLEIIESGKETWISIGEFVKISGFDIEKVNELIQEGLIKHKTISGTIHIDISTGTLAIIKRIENNLKVSENSLSPAFMEKTIATILSLHDKVVSAKDETIAAVKSENSFLKDTVISMQEVYDDDKKTIDYLREELKKREEESEFMKRKYKLMWGKVSNSTK